MTTKSTSMLKLIKRKAALVITGPDLKMSFSYSWLRDNCQCSKCIHPTTKQKLHSSGNDFDIIRPKSCSAEDDNISLEWSDHSSVYPVSWLTKYSYYAAYKPLISPVLWDREYYEQKHELVQYKDFIQNEGYQKILNQVKKYGLAFVDNAPVENETLVEEIGNKFGVTRVNRELKFRIVFMELVGM